MAPSLQKIAFAPIVVSPLGFFWIDCSLAFFCERTSIMRSESKQWQPDGRDNMQRGLHYTDLIFVIFLHRCTFGLNFSPHENASIVAKFLKISRNFSNFPKLSQNFPKFLKISQNFSTCGEIFNFPTIVIHGKLKFLHMTIFSRRI